MAKDCVHLVKLCVGAERLEDLIAWQARAAAQGPCGRPRHVTRMWPKRAEALLNGGSLFWVIKGVILARQPVLGLEPVEGADGIARCGIVLAPGPLRTEPRRMRAFQGWRYLAPEAAPADLPASRQAEATLPPMLSAALNEMGVI